MRPQDLSEWSPVSGIPSRTDGLISPSHAKRLFRDRNTNGLARKGAAAMVGRKAMLHIPTILDFVLNQPTEG